MGKFNAVPSINFDAEDVPDIPTFKPNINAPHDLELDTSYNPFKPANEVSKTQHHIPSRVNNSSWQREFSSSTNNWEKLYEQFENSHNDMTYDIHSSSINNDNNIFNNSDSTDNIISLSNNNAIQFKNRYIISPTRESLTVIDQHRAHIRILFDRYVELATNGELTTQRLIFPDILQLTAAQTIILESINDKLIQLGFDIAYLGDNSWSINGVPSVLNNTNTVDTILHMIELVESSGENIETDVINKIALSMARSAAIKPGQILSQEEIEKLLSDLLKLSTPNFTPDGKTIIASIPETDIFKLF